MPDCHIANIAFTDGFWRAVYEQPHGRQYVIDDEGEPAFGVWFIMRCSASGSS
jgi:hypothetical protein